MAPALGLNLGAFNYWSSDIPLIDQFKRTSNWLPQCKPNVDTNCSGFSGGASAWDTKERIELDDYGWPRSLPASDDNSVKYRSLAALLYAGDKGARQAGRYVVLYEGKGNIDYSLAAKKIPSESMPGRDVIAVSNNTDAGVLISITRTVPSDPIRNIRVIPPGGVCGTTDPVYVESIEKCHSSIYTPLERLAKTQVFHPAYLADLRGFRTLRFLDWTRANDSKLAEWSRRPKLTDAFWSGPYGVPLEVMFDLSKEVGADPWINIPPHVDDDYIRRFALLAKNRMGTKAVLNLEYGNEPWNYGFPAGALFEARGREKWPAAKVTANEFRLNWYAFRSAQVCAMVKEAFGDQASRVKCIVNAQAANPWNAEQILSCPLAKMDLGKACARSIDVLAIAPYFGHYIGSMAVRSTVSQWFLAPDGGVSKTFEEIFGNADGLAPLNRAGHKTPAAGALSEARTWMAAIRAVADKYALPMYAYEAGQHITREPADGDARTLALMHAVNRDPRMGKAYLRNLEDWKTSGGQTMALYYHAAPFTRAAFGLKERQFQADSPKWEAVVWFRDNVECWWAGCQ